MVEKSSDATFVVVGVTSAEEGTFPGVTSDGNAEDTPAPATGVVVRRRGRFVAGVPMGTQPSSTFRTERMAEASAQEEDRRAEDLRIIALPLLIDMMMRDFGSTPARSALQQENPKKNRSK